MNVLMLYVKLKDSMNGNEFRDNTWKIWKSEWPTYQTMQVNIKSLQNFTRKRSSIITRSVYSRNVNTDQFPNRDCSHSFYILFYSFSCSFTKFFMICGHDVG